jgi:hypothetical protein
VRATLTPLLRLRLEARNLLKPSLHLARVLWLSQVGLLLFWFYDSSPNQARTRQLVEKILAIVVALIKLSSLPLMSPIRKRVIQLVLTISNAPAPEGAREES